jgi:tRNA threonylcarbamoyladenosine biosynthesis protein TsaB
MRGEFFTAPFEVTADGRFIATGEPAILPEGRLADEALKIGGVLASPSVSPQWGPHARGVATVLSEVIAAGPCDVDTWEPTYGRLAEAQVKWEEAHGRPLSAAG